MSKENIEPFPELRIEHLKLYAEEWVRDYPIVPIERITLYRFDNPWALRIKHRRSNKGEKVNPRGKYACVVDFSKSASLDFEKLYAPSIEIESPSGKTKDKIPDGPSGTDHSQGEGGLDTHYPRAGSFDVLATIAVSEQWRQSLTVCEEFIINVMGYPDKKASRSLAFLGDASFEDLIYRHRANDEFFLDWLFIPRTAKHKPIEEHLGYIKSDRPHCILFQTDKQEKTLNEKRKKLLDRAFPEINRLYSVVKRVGVNPRHEFPEKVRKEAMLEKLKSEPFKIIRAEYLDIPGCFTWTPTQEKRYFFSFMTNVILEANGLGKINVAAVEKMRKNIK